MVGRGTPHGYTVTKPAACGSVAVTFSTTASASAGIPTVPAMGSGSVDPAGRTGAPPLRESNTRTGEMAVNPGSGMTANVAVAEWAALIVTEHVEAVPVQAPLHPENVEPVAGVAVRVTTAPEVNVALHVAPHEMPPLEEVTVPAPVPLRATESVYVGVGGAGGALAPSTYSSLSGSPQHSLSAPLVVAASSAVHTCAGVAVGLLCR